MKQSLELLVFLPIRSFEQNVCSRYPEARAIQRKIVFHAGPTNSGKTYHAIQRYLAAKSGVYCGPLKLLAHEIYEKSNDAVSFIL